MSYIKLLVGYNTVVPKSWVNNVEQSFNSLSDDNKAQFLLEQCVLVNYIKKLYNNNPPILINNYIKALGLFVNEINTNNDNNSNHDDAFKDDVGFINDLYKGYAPKRYDDLIKRLQIISKNDQYPHIFDDMSVSFYRPFLTYFGSEGGNVSISESVSIPTFAMRGEFVFVGFTTKFIGYSFTEKTRTQLDNGPYPISSDNILAYFAGYNWKDSSLNGLLGVLSTYSFDLDRSNVASNSYELIYKLLRSVITGYKSSVSPYVDSLSLSFDDTAIRRLFISFLIDLRKLHGLKLDDAQVLAKIMGDDKTEDIENLTAYLEATSAADVSTEMINSFRNSILSQFEELDIKNRAIKKKDKLVVSTSSEGILSTTNISSLKETLDAIHRHDSTATEPAPLKNASNKVDESDAKSPNKKDPFGDIGKMPTDESSTGGDVGATGDDDTTGTESDTDKDPSAMENDGNDPSNMPNQGQPETPDTHVPDLPDVSDKKGVKLELSSSESTDTVFYRLELKTYINSILANPPKSLSVEKIEILKKIKSFWINTLAPQCVHDILNTVIKLPKMFRIRNSKKSK